MVAALSTPRMQIAVNLTMPLAELHRGVNAPEMFERLHVHVAVEHFVEDGADVAGAFGTAARVDRLLAWFLRDEIRY
jgi:hypothetical protein